jgi:hypothetical protein
MEAKRSTKGQVVRPLLIRKRMKLGAGDKRDLGIEGGKTVLVARKKRAGMGRIIKDPLIGVPVLTAGKTLRSGPKKKSKKSLQNFP